MLGRRNRKNSKRESKSEETARLLQTELRLGDFALDPRNLLANALASWRSQRKKRSLIETLAIPNLFLADLRTLLRNSVLKI